MPVGIEFRFVAGEYHATAWDQAVNGGDSEWPPSPWRILRALLSTWHTRCPDIPAEVIDHLVGVLTESPPSYLLPETRAGHTRHYLPGAGHLSSELGGTSLTLAPRLHVNPKDPLVVVWPQATIDPDDAAVLERLVTDIPYLGRAESRCEAKLLDDHVLRSHGPIDQRWTTPTPGGSARVLAPQTGVTRAQLEVTPDQMRKAKCLVPSGAQWVDYRAGDTPEEPATTRATARTEPTTIRWALDSRAPFLARDGILATTGLRGAVLGVLGGDKALAADADGWIIAGPHHGTAAGPHKHAHWLWEADAQGQISQLILWVPRGVPTKWVGAIASVRRLPRFREAPKGYRSGAALHLQAIGDPTAVCPQLAVTARSWRTRTPMLTDRHPKPGRDPEPFVRRELEREFAFRAGDNRLAPTIRSVRVTRDWSTPELLAYRRYRWGESMAQRRRGFDVQVELDCEHAGPLSLGALSHFGFGSFEPIP